MALTHVLGDVPTTRILDFMLGHIEYDCTPKEVAEYADVAPSAVKRDIARLVECGVVNETRKIGGVQLYILNNSSVVTEALINLDKVVSGDVPEETAGDEEEVPEPVNFDAIDADDPKKYPESEEEWES